MQLRLQPKKPKNHVLPHHLLLKRVQQPLGSTPLRPEFGIPAKALSLKSRFVIIGPDAGPAVTVEVHMACTRTSR